MSIERLHGSFAPIATDLLRDPRFQVSSDALVLFIGLTLHANELKTDGLITTRDLRIVDAYLGWKVDRFERAYADLAEASLLTKSAGAQRLEVWFGLSRQAREAAAARQKRYRDRKRTALRDDVTRDVTRDVAVTPQRTEEEEEIREQRSEQRTDVEEICLAFTRSLEARGVVKRAVTGKWRESARLLIDRDGRQVHDILDLIDFVTFDDFWKANILSVPKLREKFDQVRLQRGRANGLKPHKLSLSDMADQLERVSVGGGLPAARTAVR